MEDGFRQTIQNLISLNSEFRKQGMQKLENNIKQIPEELLKHIARALFYYFWNSDGYQNQANDIQKIQNIIKSLDTQLQFQFFKYLMLVLIKFWNNIDIHRLNKFLLLVKNLFLFIYELQLQQKSIKIQDLNDFLLKEIFYQSNSKGILLEYGYIIDELIKSWNFQQPKKFFIYIKPIFDVLLYCNCQTTKISFYQRIEQRLQQQIKPKSNEFKKQLCYLIKSYLTHENFEQRKKYVQKLKKNIEETIQDKTWQNQNLQNQKKHDQSQNGVKNNINKQQQQKQNIQFSDSQQQENVQKNQIQQKSVLVEHNQQIQTTKNDNQKTQQKNHENNFAQKDQNEKIKDSQLKNQKEDKNNIQDNSESEEDEDFDPEEMAEEDDYEQYDYVPLEEIDREFLIEEFGEEKANEILSGEGFYDPYENMTEEEIQEKLPPYWLKTPKQKKKFFRNLNKKYKQNVMKNQRRKKIEKKKLFFQIKKNQYKIFKKTDKINQQQISINKLHLLIYNFFNNLL